MDFSWQLLKTLFYLIVIILVFYVLVRVVKNQANLQGFNQNLKILEKLHFNSNQALYLVEVIDEVWVLGVSEERVELLTKIDEEASIDKLINEKSNYNNFNWKAGLKKLWGKDDKDDD